MRECRKMTGTEYALSEVMEPNLFVIRKQKRDGPDKVNPMLTYYILDGSVYQAPQLSSVFAARIVSSSFILPFSDSHKFDLLQRGKLELKSLLWLQGRALYHISKAFNTAASKLEKIGYGICSPKNYRLFLLLLLQDSHSFQLRGFYIPLQYIKSSRPVYTSVCVNDCCIYDL